MSAGKTTAQASAKQTTTLEFKRLFSYLTAVFQGYSFMAHVRLLLDKKLAN
jgi:hypothetical protein